MGYDSYYVGRIDYEDKSYRLQTKQMEMLWQGSNLNQSDTQLFTGVTYNLYQPPPGFDFELGSTDPPIMDDPDLEEFNVADRVAAFLSYVQQQVSNFINNYYFPLGIAFSSKE